MWLDTFYFHTFHSVHRKHSLCWPQALPLNIEYSYTYWNTQTTCKCKTKQNSEYLSNRKFWHLTFLFHPSLKPEMLTFDIFTQNDRTSCFHILQHRHFGSPLPKRKHFHVDRCCCDSTFPHHGKLSGRGCRLVAQWTCSMLFKALLPLVSWLMPSGPGRNRAARNMQGTVWNGASLGA